jgi:poly(hydroxyalkanoate) depolymerase family esterase
MMNGENFSTMRETMRLMQTGDLLAATAAIQQRLRGEGASEAPVKPEGVVADESEVAARPSGKGVIEGAFRVIDDTPQPQEAPAGDASAGVAAPERRMSFSEHTYAGPAGTRRYKLFIPSAYRGQALPLIVMLHGCTQTPDDFAMGTRMNILAEERACFVVYPAQAQGANASKCWNWFKTTDQRRDRGEPAIIAGLVGELLQTYALDRDRIYVAGLSAGGAMAVILGRAYPELFAAVGVHSGLPYGAAHDLPSALAAMHRHDAAGPNTEPNNAQAVIPTIVFHGDRDTTVHPCNGEKVVSQTTAGAKCSDESGSCVTAAVGERGAGATQGGLPYTRKIFKDRAGKVIAEHWLVHGAGHAWFGGDARGSYTDARGPAASIEMLRFFLEHARVAQDQAAAA